MMLTIFLVLALYAACSRVARDMEQAPAAAAGAAHQLGRSLVDTSIKCAAAVLDRYSPPYIPAAARVLVEPD